MNPERQQMFRVLLPQLLDALEHEVANESSSIWGTNSYNTGTVTATSLSRGCHVALIKLYKLGHVLPPFRAKTIKLGVTWVSISVKLLTLYVSRSAPN